MIYINHHYFIIHVHTERKKKSKIRACQFAPSGKKTILAFVLFSGIKHTAEDGGRESENEMDGCDGEHMDPVHVRRFLHLRNLLGNLEIISIIRPINP